MSPVYGTLHQAYKDMNNAKKYLKEAREVTKYQPIDALRLIALALEDIEAADRGFNVVAADLCVVCNRPLQPHEDDVCSEACGEALDSMEFEPITLKQARDHLKTENYARYRALGGKLSKYRYNTVAAHFIYHTFDIYIGGDPCRHESRQAAWDAFVDWLHWHYPGEVSHRIFRSLDDVDAYT